MLNTSPYSHQHMQMCDTAAGHLSSYLLDGPERGLYQNTRKNRTTTATMPGNETITPTSALAVRASTCPRMSRATAATQQICSRRLRRR